MAPGAQSAEKADSATGRDTNSKTPPTNGLFIPKQSELTITAKDGGEDGATLCNDPIYPSDKNVVDRASELTNGMHGISLEERHDDLSDLPGARFGESNSESHRAASTTPRPRELSHARRGSQPAPGAPKAAVGSQRASVVSDFQRDDPESGEAKNIEGGIHLNSRRRRRASRPLSSLGFLGFDDVQEPLKDQLCARGVMERSSVSRHRKFIPAGQLSRLITQNSVELELIRLEHSRSLRRRLQVWKPSPPSASSRDFQREAKIICGEVEHSSSTLSVLENCKQVQNDQQTLPKEYRKIFAILLLINKSHRITTFIEAGVCDSDLPFVASLRDASKLSLCRSPETPLRCFHGWKDSTIAEFEENQWIVLAAIFKRLDEERDAHCEPNNELKDELKERIILPFTSWEPVTTRGGFGQVYKAKIQSDHHSFESAKEPNQVFAVKILFTNEKEVFKREVRVLKSLSCERHAHPHLITLLATYEQGERFYLIFPCAEADLLGYWSKINPTPRKTKDTALWLAEQCQGLADGLYKIHRWETLSPTELLHPNSIPTVLANDAKAAIHRSKSSITDTIHKLFGRHGDVKPNNILWFPNGGLGILKITDFGIAHFSRRDSVPAESRGPVANSPTYRAPECDLPNWMLSPSADIWALGCVYLEFITWFFGGSKGVDKFAHSRLVPDRELADIRSDTFFTIEGKKESDLPRAKVKDAVIKKVDDLCSDRTSAEFIHDFLNLVRYDMLIVEQNGLGEKRTARKSARKVVVELSSMVEKCKTIEGYLRF